MSGTSIQKQRGIQVVKMSPEQGRRWDLDETALEKVLLREDIRNLPVVVVSVAGACRGGKSFILNFFLRYLMAPIIKLNKQWLGKDSDILEGFHWRAGGDSDTKGIHLWPEPIVVDIEQTGEKVAVLLMDTQGTFDTESDMGDNSSIFALSVLLSSKQIYNIRSNIQENDLQYLQLFTEYGKLATTLEGKAFQTLLFLVRDWEHPTDYSYGYSGGKQLLDKRLAFKRNQIEQLVDVRKHIHSCFEELECFLMPRPGSCVTDREFKGRLNDIDNLFRSQLLELIPTLFDQNNLTPKTINGEQVQAQGLFEYFKQYVEIFNSDKMPQASTIFQATADASITTALREASECYESMMKTKIIEDQSVLTSMLQTWHNTALDAAIALYNSKKKFNSQENVIADNLATLNKTLETSLLLHQLQNKDKLRNALSEAEKVYGDILGTVCKIQVFICLHACDLEALHNRALTAALNSFDPTRTAVPPEVDTDRDDFIKNLEQTYQRLCLMNKRNNSNAVLEARMLYMTSMNKKVNQEDHEDCLKTAIKHFLSYRNQPSEETEDPDLDNLRQEIKAYFKDFKKANAQENLWLMNVAECAYKDYVNSEIGPKSCCFHSLALKKLHEEAFERSLEQYQSGRDETEQDDYKDKLIANIGARYQDLQKLNELNNIDAVNLAYNEYKRIMDKHLEFSYWDFLVLPYLKKLRLTQGQHETAKSEALSLFKGKRREHSYVEDDEHMRTLKVKIDLVYTSDYESYISAVEDVVNEITEQVKPLVITGVKKIFNWMKS